MKPAITLFLTVLALSCSPKINAPDPVALKPSWLKDQPFQAGYYTGIGHSTKVGSNNYVQAAKKSALDDLISQIRVTVSSTSVLSIMEADKSLQEQYEQIIKTTAADDIQEFELVDAWEDEANYWVYYRLSISRYRQIKEEQKRNATVLATDLLKKGREAELAQERVQALTYYFKALRSIEKYFGDAIRVSLEGREVLLVNEIYASVQNVLDKVKIEITPAQLTINRRVSNVQQNLEVKASYKDSERPATALPLRAAFEKGAGDIFPKYLTDGAGEAKVLLNKITSKELQQSIVVQVDIDQFANAGESAIYSLILKTLNIPRAQVNLNVQRPIVYLTADEKSLGAEKNNLQITNKLKHLLASNGFEFTPDKASADLFFDVRADSEKGSVSGSIYITYLTSIIKVTSAREGREIYATTLDRIKGYGLDYDRSSIDAYNKTMETLEKEKIQELISSVLQ